jgi:hypothetical protein
MHKRTQVDDGPEIPCGDLTGQLSTQNLLDGGHRVTIRSSKRGTGVPVAVRNVFFTVGECFFRSVLGHSNHNEQISVGV